MRVLGIETSCDDTGVALYDSGVGLLAHRLFSQTELHLDYGGVVPELASRDHIRKALPLIRAVMQEANTRPDQINGIAYTPGCWRTGCFPRPRCISITAGWSRNWPHAITSARPCP